jgi:hypothetical protein
LPSEGKRDCGNPVFRPPPGEEGGDKGDEGGSVLKDEWAEDMGG